MKKVSRRKENASSTRVVVVELHLVVVVDEAADGDGSYRGGGVDEGHCEHHSCWYGTVLLVVD